MGKKSDMGKIPAFGFWEIIIGIDIIVKKEAKPAFEREMIGNMDQKVPTRS